MKSHETKGKPMGNVDKADAAYRATFQAAREIVKSCVESIVGEMKAGNVTDVTDAIHEEVDNALIYTGTHHICVWGLDDVDADAVSDMSCESFMAALGAQAYLQLRAAIEGHSEIEEATEAMERLAELVDLGDDASDEERAELQALIVAGWHVDGVTPYATARRDEARALTVARGDVDGMAREAAIRLSERYGVTFDDAASALADEILAISSKRQ